jgi:pyruvate carboxylase subunit B
MVSGQVKDYVYGLYGKPPAPIDPEVQKTVLKGYEKGENPITCRPADTLKPEMELAEKATRGIARDIGDVLVYALYPTTGMRYLKWKYGQEKPPADTRGKTLEDIKREDELIAKVKSGKIVEKVQPARGANIRNFKIYVGEEVYDIGVEADSIIPPSSLPVIPKPVVQPVPSSVTTDVAVSPDEKAADPTDAEPAPAGETPVLAPMPGIIIQYEVEEGAEVQAEDPIVILEAMKMENMITAPIKGRVKKINFKSGDRVPKDAVLAVIET